MGNAVRKMFTVTKNAVLKHEAIEKREREKEAGDKAAALTSVARVLQIAFAEASVSKAADTAEPPDAIRAARSSSMTTSIMSRIGGRTAKSST
jgi:hypothetical protein